MKNKSIYVLNAVHANVCDDDRKGHYQKNENDEVCCYYERIGIFSSVKNAEETIHQLVKQEENRIYRSWYNEYFGFILEEHYLDNALYGAEPDWKNVRHYESCRTYLSDGTLNCFSDVDDACEKSFAGRTDKIIHIKEGDIAIECSSHKLTPILVDKLPFTESEWKEKFDDGVAGDCTDDSGIAFIAGYGHCHPFSPMVFPLSCLPHYKVTKKTLKAMNTAKKKYYSGEDL